jgi:hypothetical protein
MTVTEVALATSIPPSLARPGPGGADAGPAWRAACLASWPAAGWRVVSVNPAEELPGLGPLPAGIEARPAAPGVAEAFGRPGAWIADALGHAIAAGAPVVGLVNGDIRLDLSPAQRAAVSARAKGGLLAFNRMEVAHAAQEEGPFYRYGYDLVLMPRGMAQRLALDGFAFGVPWWDYWILLDALTQGGAVGVVRCAGIRHLAHRQAWQGEGWMRALATMMARLAPRRAALAALGMGPVAEALAPLLAAVTAAPEDGFALRDLAERAGTRFGLEIVRLAERDAWTLD